ncbi:ribonuclease T2 [Fadolivirus algeromassiliense]|jgi:ribonuclease T2|uniref:Ribonuclease T2 n=1 Tax=Fadolivirus FV1/VV64 TaxID=3070911 RepID=A0A7D3UR27_9VIRU|nr:ribonuclease T2 [Fadolivirus algeromassiliense]QKF94273.1 ribonuclease T2 [Fadolivirus FV1/VV64]
MLKLIVLLFISSLVICSGAWDYFLFVQIWPGSWLVNGNITGYNFTNDYFNIHGIWPNDLNGSWPQFCNQSNNFNVTVLDPIYTNLTIYWTDFINPIRFWEHEYLKHMTCINQTDLYGDYKYFWYGLELRQQLDLFDSLSRANIMPTNAHSYLKSNVIDTIKKTFNTDVVITCTNNSIIEEIRFCMDKSFKLFNCPDNEFGQECKSKYLMYNLYNH